MPYELKDGQGSLFKNDRKEQPNHPDYRGEANINGQLFWMSAWIKEGKNGKWMSLSFKPKDAPQSTERPKGPASVADMDNDIPW